MSLYVVCVRNFYRSVVTVRDLRSWIGTYRKELSSSSELPNPTVGGAIDINIMYMYLWVEPINSLWGWIENGHIFAKLLIRQRPARPVYIFDSCEFLRLIYTHSYAKNNAKFRGTVFHRSCAHFSASRYTSPWQRYKGLRNYRRNFCKRLICYQEIAVVGERD